MTIITNCSSCSPSTYQDSAYLGDLYGCVADQRGLWTESSLLKMLGFDHSHECSEGGKGHCHNNLVKDGIMYKGLGWLDVLAAIYPEES